MPGIGGLSIANNLLSNNIQYNLNKNQASLESVTKQLSSGLRINGPADNPAGFSIAANLQTQVNGFDQASQNIQDATNAVSVASGALTTVTNILQQVRALAVQASSNLLSSTDRQNIQTEISQLVSEVNGIANNTQFNGINLLDGSQSGFQADTGASVNILQNSALNSSQQNLVSSATISTSDVSIVDGTLEFQVEQTNFTLTTQYYYITSGLPSYQLSTLVTTLATNVYYITSNGLVGSLLTTVGNFNASATCVLSGITISLSGIATSDIGSTSYIKILQFVTGQDLVTTPALAIQTGGGEGDQVGLSLQGVSAAALRIANINIIASNGDYSYLAAEDTIGQVDNALQLVLTEQSNIGSTEIRLQKEADNDNLASLNLQASESSIRDLNVAQASTSYTKDQLLINFGTSLLSQANTNSQSVLALFR